MNHRPVLAASLVAAAAAPSPAHGQAWIGQIAAMSAQDASFRRCLKGHIAPASEIAEGVRAAQPLMADYWARASAGDAGIAGSFQGVGTAKWVEGSTVYTRSDMAGLRDPLALDPSLALASAPASFARAGAEPMSDARGVWEVRSKADPSVVAGYYVVELERFMLRWGIARIELVRAPAAPPAAAPYCAKPGDVEAYAAARAERAARKAARRAARGS